MALVQAIILGEIDQQLATVPPSPDWRTKVIPSGREPFFTDYQYFELKRSPIPGNPSKLTLIWGRVYLWLPEQEFCIMQLTPEIDAKGQQVWKETGMIHGPSEYHQLSMPDGTNTLLKLIAE